ncbi:hypothetical protein GCM10010985_59810 [Caballeronia grimmiae]|uniref:Transposase n=1 Tax=Caballeronia grimmiae TaxID=1071679 RepID=A0ABQ1S7T1_9BURK|nr:hypothetical protein GCM10010985_59810 [Caballeronia grimmiae]
MFERFGEFEMRAELESLFGIADLEMLATETDEAQSSHSDEASRYGPHRRSD